MRELQRGLAKIMAAALHLVHPWRQYSRPQQNPIRKHLQQPVHSHQQADVLRRQAHGRQNEEHGDQPSTGDTGCADARQRGCEAVKTEKARSWEEKEALPKPSLGMLSSNFPGSHKIPFPSQEIENQDPGMRIYLDTAQL